MQPGLHSAKCAQTQLCLWPRLSGSIWKQQGYVCSLHSCLCEAAGPQSVDRLLQEHRCSQACTLMSTFRGACASLCCSVHSCMCGAAASKGVNNLLLQVPLCSTCQACRSRVMDNATLL